MGRKTITIHFCDICKIEVVTEDLLSKCSACDKETCGLHSGSVRHVVTGYKPGVPHADIILDKEDNFCSECYNENGVAQFKELQDIPEAEVDKQVNVKFSE